MVKVVLVVAAHSDDEVLGCGGAIARHVAEGDVVYAVFLADGVSSREGAGASELDKRLASAERARQKLGITRNYYLGLPDNRLDSLPLIEIIRPLEQVVSEVKPHTIYTHHYGDLNVDHRIAYEAVMTSCRPLPDAEVKEIYTFEVMSSTEWSAPGVNPFIPNVYIDISPFLDKKIAALNAYADEMRDIPHSRSVEHLEILARHRGACVGLMAAEAFMLVRSVV